MGQFFISLLFFVIALGFFWLVLNWVEYKKEKSACACGSGACESKVDKTSDKIVEIRQYKDHEPSCHQKGTHACTCK